MSSLPTENPNSRQRRLLHLQPEVSFQQARCLLALPDANWTLTLKEPVSSIHVFVRLLHSHLSFSVEKLSADHTNKNLFVGSNPNGPFLSYIHWQKDVFLIHEAIRNSGEYTLCEWQNPTSAAMPQREPLHRGLRDCFCQTMCISPSPHSHHRHPKKRYPIESRYRRRSI